MGLASVILGWSELIIALFMAISAVMAVMEAVLDQVAMLEAAAMERVFLTQADSCLTHLQLAAIICGNGGSGGMGYLSLATVLPGGSGGGGGGIYDLGSLDLTSCTVALNQTGLRSGGNRPFSSILLHLASGGQGGDGGGILNDLAEHGSYRP